MVEIIPAILVKDKTDFSSKINAVAPYVKCVQIDIMDGKFVPNTTLAIEEMPPIPSSLEVEYHLMVEKPLEYIKKIQAKKFGNKNVVYALHVESLADIGVAIAEVKKMGGKVALAISPDTPVEKLEPYLKKIKHVLVMTVYPGFSGQSYLSKMEEKMKWLSARGVVVEVDGGVGIGSAKTAAKAGATLLNVASAIFSKSDTKKAIEELEKDARTD